MKSIKVIFMVICVLSLMVTSTGGESLNTSGATVTSMQARDGTLLVGTDFGQVIVSTKDTKLMLENFELRNQIIDVELIEDRVYALSEYNYTTIFDIDTGDIINRIMYNSSISGIERLNRTHLVVAEVGQYFSIWNLETDEYTSHNITDIVSQDQSSICFGCRITDIQVENTTLFVAYGGRIYTIKLDNMSLQQNYLITNDISSDIEIEGSEDTMIYAIISSGTYGYVGGEQYSTNAIIRDIEFHDQIILATDEGIQTKKAGVWMIQPRSDDIMELEVANGKLFAGGVDRIIEVDDIFVPKFYPVILFLLILLFAGGITRGFQKIFHTLLVTRDRKLLEEEAKEHGYDSVIEYLDAQSKGFSDKRIERVITDLGYDTYQSFSRATKSITEDQYDTIYQSRNQKKLSIPLELDNSEKTQSDVERTYEISRTSSRSKYFYVAIMTMIRYIDIIAALVVLSLLINLWIYSGIMLLEFFILIAGIIVFTSVIYRIIDFRIDQDTTRRIMIIIVFSIIIGSSLSLSTGSPINTDSINLEDAEIKLVAGRTLVLSETSVFEIRNEKFHLLDNYDKRVIDVASIRNDWIGIDAQADLYGTATTLNYSGTGIIWALIMPDYIGISEGNNTIIYGDNGAILAEYSQLLISETVVCGDCLPVNGFQTANGFRLFYDAGYIADFNQSGQIFRVQDIGLDLTDIQIDGRDWVVQTAVNTILVKIDGHMTTIVDSNEIEAFSIDNGQYIYATSNAIKIGKLEHAAVEYNSESSGSTDIKYRHLPQTVHQIELDYTASAIRYQSTYETVSIINRDRLIQIDLNHIYGPMYLRLRHSPLRIVLLVELLVLISVVGYRVYQKKVTEEII